jgi:LAS superfamily LD-carboxypeptidase LdcB
MQYKIQREYIILILFVLASAGMIGYFNYQNNFLEGEVANLKKNLSKTEVNFVSTTENLRNTINSLSEELSATKEERDNFEEKYNDEKKKMDFLALQISGLEGTVGLLEKLSETDPELLKKYSKVYFLNENYVPEELVKIPSLYTYNPDEEYLFYSKTWPFLENLLSAADEAGVDMKIISAYRSFHTQSGIKNNYKMIYGSGANEFSADQGYSEHQLGTTVDFTTSAVGASYSGFDETKAYQWLSDNAHKYGFTLSYPEDNQYYQFEPWHWRFVSRSLAERLYQEGKHFYELDQRKIDQHLIFFFD